MEKAQTELPNLSQGKACSHHSQPTPRPSLQDLPRERELLEALLDGLSHPADPVERLALGGRFLALSAGGRVGLASTLGARPAPGDRERAAALTGAPLSQAAALLLEDSPWLASLGLAALNAACTPPRGARFLGAGNLLEDLGRGRRVVVIGEFPFTAGLAEVASELHLLELRPEAATLPAGEWSQALAQCQVAAITATTLLTRALAWALESAPSAVKVVIGPSTPWSPVLFDWGADILAGSQVAKPEPVMEAVGQGLPFKQIKKQGVEALAWARPGSKFQDSLWSAVVAGFVPAGQRSVRPEPSSGWPRQPRYRGRERSERREKRQAPTPRDSIYNNSKSWRGPPPGRVVERKRCLAAGRGQLPLPSDPVRAPAAYLRVAQTTTLSGLPSNARQQKVRHRALHIAATSRPSDRPAKPLAARPQGLAAQTDELSGPPRAFSLTRFLASAGGLMIKKEERHGAAAPPFFITRPMAAAPSHDGYG